MYFTQGQEGVWRGRWSRFIYKWLERSFLGKDRARVQIEVEVVNEGLYTKKVEDISWD